MQPQVSIGAGARMIHLSVHSSQVIAREPTLSLARGDQMKRAGRLVARMLEAGSHAAEKVSDHYFERQDFEQALIWQKVAEWFVQRKMKIG
jgi:hypothetical protein